MWTMKKISGIITIVILSILVSVGYGSEALNIVFDDGYDEFWDFAEFEDYESNVGYKTAYKGGYGMKNGAGYGWDTNGGGDSASKPTSSHGS